MQITAWGELYAFVHSHHGLTLDYQTCKLPSETSYQVHSYVIYPVLLEPLAHMG